MGGLLGLRVFSGKKKGLGLAWHQGAGGGFCFFGGFFPRVAGRVWVFFFGASGAGAKPKKRHNKKAKKKLHKKKTSAGSAFRGGVRNF